MFANLLRRSRRRNESKPNDNAATQRDTQNSDHSDMMNDTEKTQPTAAPRDTIVDLSRDYSKLKIHANKEPLTFDPEELRVRLKTLKAAQRGANDPPYNDKFWTAIMERLLPAQHPNLGYKQPPGEDGGYQIRSLKDVHIGLPTFMACKPFVPISPLQLAEITGVSLEECLVELLYATSSGLMQMSWTTVCAVCGGNTEIHHNLGHMHKHVQCQLCLRKDTVDALDSMRVAFSLDQCVLYAPFGDVLECPTSPEAPRMKYFFMNICAPPTTNNTKWSYLFGFEDEEEKSQPALEKGRYRFRDSYGSNGEYFIEIGRDATKDDEPLRVLLKASEMGFSKVLKLEHGKVRLDLLSDKERFVGIYVYKDIPEDMETMYSLPQSARAPITSAADLIHIPCFKTLFGDQVVSSNESFSIRRVVLVFTDVVSSTDLYEASGDGKALKQVQDHFQIVFKAFESKGRIVKTIGDAVMGAFTCGEKALLAVAQALDGITKMDIRPDGKPFQIRVGVHAGPALVVPLNGINDYFGRNVNIAARVEATAVGGECLVSEAVLEDPAARAEFEKLLDQGYSTTRRETVTLKGVPDPVSVHGFQSKLA